MESHKIMNGFYGYVQFAVRAAKTGQGARRHELPLHLRIRIPYGNNY
jgi:hypothetical protein